MPNIGLVLLGTAIALAAPAAAQPKDRDMTADGVAQGTDRAFSYVVTTTAAPETIWRLWTDVSSWKMWDKGLRDATLDGPMALGARGRIIPLSGPSSSFRVTAFEPQRSYTFETSLPLAKLVVRRTLVSTAPVMFRHDVSFTGALAGTWAKRFGPQFRSALPPTMQALATLAEGK